jgi:hypothetical protein
VLTPQMWTKVGANSVNKSTAFGSGGLFDGKYSTPTTKKTLCDDDMIPCRSSSFECGGLTEIEPGSERPTGQVTLMRCAV